MRANFSPSRSAAVRIAALGLAAFLTGCGTGPRPLPKYERPLARTTFQTVRTTAYTHTESDHVEYGNHNALGGTLHAAGPPAVAVRAAIPVATAVTPFAPDPMPAPPPAAIAATGGVYGSAAADWSRWPAGTVFRLIPTGQLYKVDDYGWALSGRNTIDLYMPSRATMNAWGVREEQIQILQWGDRGESLRRLTRHQKYRHIRRMVLELEGRERAASNLK